MNELGLFEVLCARDSNYAITSSASCVRYRQIPHLTALCMALLKTHLDTFSVLSAGVRRVKRAGIRPDGVGQFQVGKQTH